MRLVQSHAFLVSCFFLLILLAYSNTFTAAWHLDDGPNILANTRIHMQDMDAASLSRAFWANAQDSERLARPISYLSFALNWYLGADHVLGYHVVNILLHWANAVLLYAIILRLLPFALPDSPKNKAWLLLAAFAVLLWALNPIQTQAVTYVVQRMAVLATFFYLAALFFYLLARQAKKKSGQYGGFFLTLICFILAVGSKENAITLPIAILLIEWIFFRSLGRMGKKHIAVAAIFLVFSTVAALILTKGDPLTAITLGYEGRSFTLEERLLTEGRIVVWYLSLLFFPAPWRLSLEHDVSLSTSLLQPPSTLLALIFLFLLLCWSLWQHKKYPLASFAILFFLLNHLVESTIFPLELVFEHRNYLPSLFLFLPLTLFCANIYERAGISSQPKVRKYCLWASCLLIITLVVATFARNRVWQTEQNLWEDCLTKAPGQARPHINLAHIYRNMGKNDEAFALSRQSLDKVSPAAAKDRMRGYTGMAEVELSRGNIAEAVKYYQQALTSYDEETLRYRFHLILAENGQTEAAIDQLETLRAKHPKDGHLALRMGILLAETGDYVQAKTMMEQAIALAPAGSHEVHIARIGLGSVLSRQGDFTGAEKEFVTIFSTFDPRLSLLCIIANDLNQGNEPAGRTHTAELLKHFALADILALLQSKNTPDILFPLDKKELADQLRVLSEQEHKAETGR